MQPVVGQLLDRPVGQRLFDRNAVTVPSRNVFANSFASAVVLMADSVSAGEAIPELSYAGRSDPSSPALVRPAGQTANLPLVPASRGRYDAACFEGKA
ncbi:MAG: hypothetical protein U0736_21865 [Gemmataceae bacterium]